MPGLIRLQDGQLFTSEQAEVADRIVLSKKELHSETVRDTYSLTIFKGFQWFVCLQKVECLKKKATAIIEEEGIAVDEEINEDLGSIMRENSPKITEISR